ncbi:hypothetical protein GCM10011492_30670 [Flexivirga endophytica]|uniref:ATP-binding protein n=1 Tax=Flexivirga endophytica TaxID=1849103 RepID=A0A916TAK2_9MICO|nr:hypothetical protein [Flexivirga endophytica]GGB37782.1 hypothetical protein GCM10011492_30670 [Flexivirga endophytica]GHB45292.1 hypothetical protein GCM10008112_13060 [Flexivirga endophytica]
MLASVLRPIQRAGVWTDGRARQASEASITVVAVVVRGVVVITALASAPVALRTTRDDLAYTTVAVLALLVSCGLCVDALRRARMRARPWGVADLVTCLLSIVVCSSVSSQSTSWMLGHFDMPYAINAASLAAGWTRSMKWSLAISATIAATLVGTAALSDTRTLAVTLSSACNVVLFGVGAAIGAGYLRRLGASFDELHQEMLTATKLLELDRYLMQVHDASTMLRMLADEGTPASTLPALRQQARKESLRLRAYFMKKGAPEPPGSPATLAGVVRAATEGFTDLPLVVHTALAEQVALGQKPALLLLQRAVTTLLYNVRIHANARAVTVHADQEDHEWELTVHDDGVGFEPGPSSFGFGLQEQVFTALQSRGIGVRLDSRPGHGTLVTITGVVNG